MSVTDFPARYPATVRICRLSSMPTSLGPNAPMRILPPGLRGSYSSALRSNMTSGVCQRACGAVCCFK